jgi:hypothetical protein
MLDDILGSLLGCSAGTATRRAYFRRKLRRAERGATVRVKVRAHPSEAPEWKYWRGHLSFRKGRGVEFVPLPLVFWWRGFSVERSQVIGPYKHRDNGVKRFAIHDATADHIELPDDAAEVVECVIRRAAS